MTTEDRIYVTTVTITVISHLPLPDGEDIHDVLARDYRRVRAGEPLVAFEASRRASHSMSRTELDGWLLQDPTIDPGECREAFDSSGA